MDITQQLIDELFELTENKPRCPHIIRDENRKPYCGKGMAQDLEINWTRRMACDVYSLQLYCLNGPERHTSCIYYDSTTRLGLNYEQL